MLKTLFCVMLLAGLLIACDPIPDPVPCEETIIKGIVIDEKELYSFDCVKTEFINETIIGYKNESYVVIESRFVCDGFLKNGSDDCNTKNFNVTKYRLVPLIDGNKYELCRDVDRKEVTVAKGLINEKRISLENKMSKIQDDTIIIKDLTDGASWGDARPLECWHPQIPCEQIDLKTGAVIFEVAR